jgi:hypothetical protein
VAGLDPHARELVLGIAVVAWVVRVAAAGGFGGNGR